MMEQSVPPRGWRGQIRLLLLAVAGIVAIGAAVFLGLRDGSEPTVPPVAVEKPRPPADATAGAPSKPSFDIVRVNPKGDAVIAGHAAPGSDIRIEEAGREIGHAQADEHGDWVFVPTEPLPPGTRELTLTARSPDGRETKSDGSVLLVVPDHGQAQVPVAVLSTPEAPPSVLQSAPDAGKGLGLEAADFDEHGAARLAGRAPPGASVRVYLDDKPVGDARADAEGRWVLSPQGTVEPGEHHVRLDQIGTDGHVIARVLAPVPRELAEAPASAAGHVVVRPGETLWRLARNAYGSGARYTLLYQANRAKIEDPALIYPGQTFAVPAMRGSR
jgi:hypothetical protein